MNDARASVAFIGPMGSGKTSIGRRVAKRLDVPFSDTDAMIVAEHGPIADYFVEHGEEAFRRIERDVVAEALTRGGVVALGGGAVVTEQTRQALARHHVVLLTVSERTIRSRIRGSKRPLLNAPDPVAEWSRIAAARRPIYEALADVTYDTSNGPLRLVIEAASKWAAERLGVTIDRKDTA